MRERRPEADGRIGARSNRLQSDQKFKVGLFGMNCSSSVATTAPERWNAEWPDMIKAARLADEGGIDFVLPIARWLGYGGVTDRHGTTFETLSWASAILAATKELVAFATVHVPLVHPVFVAKSAVTVDHVGAGRFGLNVVSGWNVGEFAMFGANLLPHDERYAYTEEWLGIVKRIWSEDAPFDHAGTYFKLTRVEGKPKPWGNLRPLIMSAGSSQEGRAFAARHADCIFMVITDTDKLAGEIEVIRASHPSKRIECFASGHIITRPTTKETQEYYRYLVHEHGDWEAAENAMSKRLAGESRSIAPERIMAMKERFISGGGTYPVIGSYDDAAAILKRLSDAGLAGMALATVNYVNDMPILCHEILPRLERLGVRHAR